MSYAQASYAQAVDNPVDRQKKAESAQKTGKNLKNCG